jgi:hypothetical protein
MPPFEPESLLVDLQTAIKQHLIADTWFSGIAMFTPDDMTEKGSNEGPSDIEQRIEQSLSSLKQGVCILILFPQISGIASDSPGIYADNIPIFIRVIENPLVNRGSSGIQKTASMVMIRIMRRLQHFSYRECVLVLQTARHVPDESNLVWDVIGKTAVNFPALEVS